MLNLFISHCLEVKYQLSGFFSKTNQLRNARNKKSADWFEFVFNHVFYISALLINWYIFHPNKNSLLESLKLKS